MFDLTRIPPTILLGGLSAAALLSCGPRQDPDLAYHRGINALGERRFEYARTYFAEDLERSPEKADSWRLAGHAWLSGSYQSPTRAAEHWQRYLELRPDDTEIARRLTQTLLLLGEWQQAQEWSERLDDSTRSRVLRARVWLDDDSARAAKWISAAGDSTSKDPRFHATAAEVFQRVGDLENARLHAGRAVELAPLDARSTYLLFRLERQLGDAERAADLLATHQILTRLNGIAGAAKPTPVEALRLVRELEARVGASNLEVRLKKLQLLADNGKHAEARTVLASLDHEASIPHLTLAGVAQKIGDLDTARRLLEHALRQTSANEPQADGNARQREALYGLALLARRQRDPEAALARVRDGLQRYPFAARFHHLLGRLELEAGQSEAATERFERALELAPWKSDCRIDLANLWFATGRGDEVAQLLSAAPGEDPAIEGYERRHGLR